jgi:hypothetical protein
VGGPKTNAFPVFLGICGLLELPTRNPPLMSLRAPGRNEGLIGQLVTLGAPPSIIRAAAKPHRW